MQRSERKEIEQDWTENTDSSADAKGFRFQCINENDSFYQVIKTLKPEHRVTSVVYLLRMISF